jgi:hypothetical protein
MNIVPELLVPPDRVVPKRKPLVAWINCPIGKDPSVPLNVALVPQFTTDRMVKEYTQKYYQVR